MSDHERALRILLTALGELDRQPVPYIDDDGMQIGGEYANIMSVSLDRMAGLVRAALKGEPLPIIAAAYAGRL